MSDIRFNPPPGWPLVARGGLPPSDWQPDPALPPAPSGWPFYLDQRGRPASVPTDAWAPPPQETNAERTDAAKTNAEKTEGTVAGRHRGDRRPHGWRTVVAAVLALGVLALAVLVTFG